MRLILLLACVPVLFAQPDPLRNLASSAMSAPPELAANALLILVENGKIADPKWKRDLIETAWNLAPRAAFQNPVGYAIQSNVNSDTDVLFDALRSGLTASGLQSRAIIAMDPLDYQRAREMFLAMPRPAYVPLACEADRYDSHTPWFTALTDVAQRFTPDERATGSRTVFLTEQIRSLATPEDFDTALTFLNTQTEFGELINVWASQLERASFTDRVYSSRPHFWLPLITQMTNRGLSPVPVLTAARSYFVRHESADRCGETPSRLTRDEAARKAFNEMAALHAPGIAAIKPEEIQPASIGAKAKVDDYFKSEGMRTTAAKYEHLAAGRRTTPEWNQEALGFLDHLESSKDLFHQKCSWYSGLFDLLPEGDLRDRVLRSFLTFLVSSTIERESPAEWFLWVKRLIVSREVKDREHWLTQIEAGGDATMLLYVKLNRLTAQ